MTNKYSLAHLTVISSSPPEMIYLAKSAGYDYVSLRPIYMGLPKEPNYELATNKQMMSETKSAFSNTGLKLLDIELARIYDDMDPKEYEPAFEVGAELGGKHVLSSIWTDDRNYAIEQFGEVCEIAEQYGLTVELEYVPIASISDLAGAVDVLNSVNKDNAGIMLDVHHFHRAQDKLEALDKIPREWFRFAHICDSVVETPKSKEELTRILREERLYIGEGGIDIAGIINRIPKVPYSIELPNIKRSRELGNEEFARRCLEHAKDYFEKHPREGSK